MDIFFSENYGKLCETIQAGTCHVFEHKSKLGSIRHMYIKRRIPITINQTTYYDLITPFRYGGPLILSCGLGQKEELVQEFERKFQQHCLNHSIVSEFVRFHPLVNNASDFQNCYQIRHTRYTLGTDLAKYPNFFKDEFSKSARKSIRRCIRAGLTYNIVEGPTCLNSFKRIYYASLDRNQASAFNYFDDNYFNTCLRFFKDNIVLVEAIYQGKVVSVSLNLVDKSVIHVHLSGTLTEYLWLSPAYIVKYATAMWGQNRGIGLIHYGGGITNRARDSLYQFKAKFSKNTKFHYYTGQKVWQQQVYQHLCGLNGLGPAGGFFPAYRRSKKGN